MIDLAVAELEEIRRTKAQLVQVLGGSLEAFDSLLAARFPGRRLEVDLNIVERRLWLNELRRYQRGQELPQSLLQPKLPFTGGVNESINQK